MINKLNTKYHAKKNGAKKGNIGFELSFQEYCQLAEEAGISADDIGIRKYHLSRNGDIGPYKIGNCRFKWCLENIRERKATVKSRLASANNIKLGFKYKNTKEREDILKKATQGWKKYWDGLTEEQRKSHMLKMRSKNPRVINETLRNESNKQISRKPLLKPPTEEEIERKRMIIKETGDYPGSLKVAANRLGMSYWGVLNFIQHYPVTY